MYLKANKQTLFLAAYVLFFVGIIFFGCEPKDPGVALPNQPPSVRLANVPVNDPVLDTLGTDGKWNAAEHDLGTDGLPDEQETGCKGAFDPVTNRDPAYDNFDSTGVDSCTVLPGGGHPLKNDRNKYTQNNGKPDVGEPHVYPFRLTKSPIVSLYWVGNDGDGFVTGFAYRWTFKERMSDTVWKYNPSNPLSPADPFYKWRVIVNYVIPSSSGSRNLVLLMDLDTATAKIAAPSVFKFFANASLDPERIKTDTALSRIYKQLDSGKTVIVNGYPVYASNPPTVQYPVHESPNSGTFVFESDDLKNRHLFEIVAIDNEQTIGKRDSINFWTPKVEPPLLNFVQGGTPGLAQIFVLKNKTYTWPGIRFEYRGRDRNSRTLEYSWKVDTREWSPWSSDNYTYITASEMDTPYTGPHIFRVRCRNEFGVITPESGQPWTTFNTVYPRFAEDPRYKRVLIVHSSRLSRIDSLHKPDLNRMVEYYRILMDSLNLPYDIWIAVGRGHPQLPHLALYSSVYLITDQYVPFEPTTNPGSIRGGSYYRYLDVGGRMIYNGLFYSSLISVGDANFLDSVLVRRMHLFSLLTPPEGFRITDIPRRSGTFSGIFAGATGYLGYPDVQLDPTKLPPGASGIAFCSVNRPRGFGEIIYRFDATNDSVLFENQPMGFRYDGITFKTVYLGFPLYFIQQNQAVAVLRKAFRDIGELKP